MAKKILIGLDGVPYSLIKDFTECGIMPNTGTILKEGRLYEITSSLPEISSVSWSTIITGENPGEHGIYGFTDLAPESYTTIFLNFGNIKREAFWLNSDFTPKQDKRYAILNVPATYPAKPVNGVHISGFVALDLDKAVYPQSLLELVEETGYKIDVDAYKAHESMSFFLKDLQDTLEKRIEAARKIWHMEEWDVFMLVFTGTDRLSHFLWDAYEDVNHKYHEDFLNHFTMIDGYIGELYSELDHTDTIAFMSDHGIERLDKEVFINRYLYEWGYLKLRNCPAKSYNDIEKGTIAFCFDPGRIYLNYETRYPRGTVKEEQRKTICRELTDRFHSLFIDGKNVVKEVFLGEEIYEGPYSPLSPDLILLSEKGFALKGDPKSTSFYTKNIFNGKHSYHDTFFGLKLPSSENNNYPGVKSVQDIRKSLGL